MMIFPATIIVQRRFPDFLHPIREENTGSWVYTLLRRCFKKGNDGTSLLPPFGESEPCGYPCKYM